MPPTGAATDTQLKQSGQSWLRDQGLQLLVLLTSVLTGTTYLVGRAGLMGWYDTAGVPTLSFAWSFQDVVIRGMADVETWLVVVVTGIGFALYFVVTEIISGRISKWTAKLTRIRERGETCDQHALRARLVGRARYERLMRSASAPIATAHWRALGKRKPCRPKTSKFTPTKRRPSSVILASIGILSLLLMLIGLYIAGAVLLFERPYRAGAQRFHEEHLAATGKPVPSRQEAAWNSARRQPSLDIDPDRVQSGRSALTHYAFVKVTADGATECGWLIQASGNQLLLLTRVGLALRYFGDGAYRWQSIPPNMCP